jgi:hypothetical protein
MPTSALNNNISSKFSTSIVIYSNKSDGHNVFLLFKKPFSDPEQWEVLEQNSIHTVEEVQIWLAEYLGVNPDTIDMERVKYLQNQTKSNFPETTTRVLVFKIEENEIKKVDAINPNTLWTTHRELPYLLGQKTINQTVNNILNNIHEWRLSLDELRNNSRISGLLANLA